MVDGAKLTFGSIDVFKWCWIALHMQRTKKLSHKLFDSSGESGNKGNGKSHHVDGSQVVTKFTLIALVSLEELSLIPKVCALYFQTSFVCYDIKINAINKTKIYII